MNQSFLESREELEVVVLGKSSSGWYDQSTRPVALIAARWEIIIT